MENSTTNLTDEENLVYSVIKQETKTSGGILQAKLREKDELKHMHHRRLAAIINRLVKANLIKRIAVDNNGRSTYLLQTVEPQKQSSRLIQISNLDILSIPCYGCKNLYACGEGRVHNPSRCSYLTRFLMEKINTSE